MPTYTSRNSDRISLCDPASGASRSADTIHLLSQSDPAPIAATTHGPPAPHPPAVQCPVHGSPAASRAPSPNPVSQSTPNLSPPPTQPHPAYRPPGPADPAKPMAFSKSTMFTKISDMHRGMVDKAIIDRDPPTYKEIYETFALPDHGVSFSAFYFYARRIRMLQSLDAGRHADLPRPEDLDAGIRDAITQRLYETLNNPDEPAPLDLQRLVSTWRHAIQTCRSLQESRDASSKK